MRRATHRMQCDFAFWVGGTHQNAADVAELERLPGAAGIKVFMGSSTGSLLVEDDDGVATILRRTRRAQPSTARTNIACAPARICAFR